MLSKLHQLTTVWQIVTLTITTSAMFYKATNLIKITIVRTSFVLTPKRYFWKT